MTDRLETAIRELAAALLAELELEARHAASDTPERLYSISEASELLSLGRTLVYTEMQAGRLRSIKAGRRRLIPSSAVAEYARGGRS